MKPWLRFFLSGALAVLTGGVALAQTTVVTTSITQVAVLSGTGQVAFIDLTNSGANYSTAPTITISGGGGSGATAVANINLAGAVSNITITNPGSGYTSPPTVSFGPAPTPPAPLLGVAAAATAYVGTPFVAPNQNESYGPAGTTIAMSAVSVGTFPAAGYTVQFFVDGVSIGTAATHPPSGSPASIGWAPPRPGAYFLTVVSSDGLGHTATSLPVRYFAVGTAITSPTPNTIVPNSSSVVIQATATPQPLTGGGANNAFVSRMDFYADGVLVGTDATAPYSLIYTPANPPTVNSPNNRHIVETRAFDNNGNQISPNGTATLNLFMVPPIGTPPTCVISSPANNAILPIPSGSSGPISVAVAAGSPTGLITKVELYIDGVLTGTSTTFPYSFSWTPTVVGTYKLIALAYDDKSNVVASSIAPASTSITIAASPTITLVAPVAGATVGAGSATTLTAAATDSNVGGGIASVQFFANGTLVGSASSPASGNNFSVSWTPSVAGTASITALAINRLGLSTASTAVSVSVTGGGGGGGGGTPPTVSITSPAGGATLVVNAPQTVTATATANTATGTVTSVQFLANGTPIATATAFPYSVPWTPSTPGTYALTAVATDNSGGRTTSAANTVTVSSGTAPTASIVSPASGASVSVGIPQTVVANAAAGSGTIVSVQFFANGASLGTSTTFPYNQVWVPTGAGSVDLTVVVTNSLGNQTRSAVTTVAVGTVSPGAPTVSLSSPSAGASFTVGTPITVAASASDADGTITNVAFFANGAPIGSKTTFPYIVQFTPPSPGNYILTAQATDNGGNIATSATVAVSVVGGSAPTIAITAPVSGGIVGVNTPQTITATAASSTAFVTSVQFFLNGTLLGTDNTFPYSTPWTPLAVGTYSLTARATDNAGNLTDSAPVLVVVAPSAAPTISITNPINGSAYTVRTPVNLAATAADSDGTVTQVQFFVNGLPQGSALTASPYFTAWTPASTGTYVVTAQATDNTANVTTSSVVTVTIGANAPPTVGLTSPAAGLSYALGNQILVAASANDSDGTVASVQFFANGLLLGTSTSAPFTFSWRPTVPGGYTLTAVATDNVGNITTSAASSITVTSVAAPSITIINPLSTQSYGVGNSIPFVASTSGGNGPIAQVQFFVNGAPLAIKTSSPYTTTWAPGAPGSYSLLAVATDSAGISSNSAALSVVIRTNEAPTVALTFPSNNATTVAGSAITLTASAADVDGTVASVLFLVNGNPVGAAATSAPFTTKWTPTAAGNYSVVAQATDNSGNVTSSSSISVSVLANQPPVVTLASPANGTVLRTGASTGLIASASDPDGTVTSVQFLANGNVVGTATTAPYSATWTPSIAGNYTVVAQATDNTGNVTTSTATSVTVLANQLPSVSFTSPTNGAVVRAGSATTLSANASDADGSIASVQFLINGVSLGAPLTTVTTNGYRTQWTPAAEGIYTITATALDNSGASSSATATVLVVNSASGGDTVYTGALFGLGESGKFAVVNISRKSAAFIAYSTIGAGKVYFYPSIPVTTSGNFTLTDSGGRVLVAGKLDETAATITTLDGAATTQIGLVASPVGANVAAGYYTGSLSGRSASQLAAIVGVDGSIMLVALDGSVRTAGAGFVDNAGAFQNIAASAGGAFSGKVDPLTKFLSGNLTGPIAAGMMGAIESGISFSDGFLRNLSSRGQVGAGNDVLVAGFVVGGTTSKQILIRAIGPSLAQFGITGALADPQVKLFGGTGGSAQLASNDNWGGSAALTNAANSVGAFPLSPTSLDSVVIATLAPGNYTAQVSSAGTGVALIELYDIDNPTPYSSQKVMNISTRAVVGTGQNRLIAGFVVNGSTAKKVLIRAVGPTLGAAPFNLPGVLADPVLRLIRNSDNMLVRENDNWEVGNDVTLVSDAGTKSGAFPLASGSRDAAILISLPPGSYSAEVTGTGTSTGVALVEVYEVP